MTHYDTLGIPADADEAVEEIFLDAKYRADPPPRYGGSSLLCASSILSTAT